MNGYGYQWNTNPRCCKAVAVEAGSVADCPDSGWFWISTLVILGIAILAPKGKR